MPHLHLPSSGKHPFLWHRIWSHPDTEEIAREGTSVGIKRTSFGGLWPLKKPLIIAFESCTMRILYMYIKGRVSMPSSFSIASESHWSNRKGISPTSDDGPSAASSSPKVPHLRTTYECAADSPTVRQGGCPAIKQGHFWQARREGKVIYWRSTKPLYRWMC